MQPPIATPRATPPAVPISLAHPRFLACLAIELLRCPVERTAVVTADASIGDTTIGKAC
jgi:hypothetical protein